MILKVVTFEQVLGSDALLPCILSIWSVVSLTSVVFLYLLHELLVVLNSPLIKFFFASLIFSCGKEIAQLL